MYHVNTIMAKSEMTAFSRVTEAWEGSSSEFSTLWLWAFRSNKVFELGDYAHIAATYVSFAGYCFWGLKIIAESHISTYFFGSNYSTSCFRAAKLSIVASDFDALTEDRRQELESLIYSCLRHFVTYIRD